MFSHILTVIKKIEIEIQIILKSENSVILASCRSNVIKDSQCSIFSRCVYDLNAGDLEIDNEQKLKIAN